MKTALDLAQATKESHYLVAPIKQWIDRCAAELDIDDDDEEEEEDEEDEEPEVIEVDTPPELPPAKAPIAPAKAPVELGAAPAAAATVAKPTNEKVKTTVLYRYTHYNLSGVSYL